MKTYIIIHHFLYDWQHVVEIGNVPKRDEYLSRIYDVMVEVDLMFDSAITDALCKNG